MKFGNSDRHTAILAALYAFFVIGALLNILAGPRFSLPVLTPFVMAIVGIGAFVLTYELDIRTIGAAAGTVFFLFCCQALGVNSGVPFGDFAYTSLLGPKVLDVPVVIPFAWLAILIPAWAAADKVLQYRNIVVASIVVTAFDSVLEFAADGLDLWHWKGGLPTELNAISWFGVSYLAFSLLEKYARAKDPNPVVPHLLFAQLLYFALTDTGLRFLVPR